MSLDNTALTEAIKQLAYKAFIVAVVRVVTLCTALKMEATV